MDHRTNAKYVPSDIDTYGQLYRPNDILYDELLDLGGVIDFGL